ncbi:hypothetical protein DevBK_12855 [Devosia sp. BK]|nr:hypothetical protein [Devosia sp. BK]MDV3252222.1 hypothetical protein [Devosia sp. BK]
MTIAARRLAATARPAAAAAMATTQNAVISTKWSVSVVGLSCLRDISR